MTSDNDVEAVAIDLDAIEKRLKAATPGPWCVETCGSKGDGSYMVGVAFEQNDDKCKHQMSGWLQESDDDGNEIEYYRDALIADCDFQNSNPGADAIFIAHAITDLAVCIAEIRAHRAQAAFAALNVPAREKLVCHVCGEATDIACSDCRINLAATVYVCPRKSCRDYHDEKCSEVLARKFGEHTKAVKQFLIDLAETTGAATDECSATVQEMCDALLEAAQRERRWAHEMQHSNTALEARIKELEAANAAQSVRIATLLEDNHCIPELEARIKELEAQLAAADENVAAFMQEPKAAVRVYECENSIARFNCSAHE